VRLGGRTLIDGHELERPTMIAKVERRGAQ
jgi:hypothetical protein